MKTFVSPLLLPVLVAFSSLLHAQVTTTHICDKDAALGYHDGYSTHLSNYGGATQLAAYSIPGAIGGENNNRAVFEFDLSGYTTSAILLEAKLTLYAFGPIGVYSGHTGSANNATLRRITSAWDESTVTWSSAPSFTTANEVTLPVSTSPTQDYIDIDVTALVQDMIANPSTSHGFRLAQVVENPTQILAFASSDHSDALKAPKLVITCIENCQALGAATAAEAAPEGITVSPNPTSSIFTVRSSGADWLRPQIDVLDAQGRIVSSQTLDHLNAASGYSFNAFDLGLQSGIYFVRVTSTDRQDTQKVLVIR